VVDVHAPLLHHLGEVAIAQRVLAIPAHAHEDDFNREAAALENGHRSTGSSVEADLILPLN
jgi:hypothetical protein